MRREKGMDDQESLPFGASFTWSEDRLSIPDSRERGLSSHWMCMCVWVRGEGKTGALSLPRKQKITDSSPSPHTRCMCDGGFDDGDDETTVSVLLTGMRETAAPTGRLWSERRVCSPSTTRTAGGSGGQSVCVEEMRRLLLLAFLDVSQSRVRVSCCCRRRRRLVSLFQD